MLTRDGQELPDNALLGVIQGQWPIRFFHNEDDAAKWLEEDFTGAPRRRVFRFRLTPVAELEYVPPVPAKLSEREVVTFAST